jgi:uncharacterized membrane protein YkgB
MPSLVSMDRAIIAAMRRLADPVSRFALALLYVWFGGLKVIGISPATPLVTALQEITLPVFAPDTFMVLFGLLEVLIGLLFLWPGMERVVLPLMAAHMVTTVLPLVLLPDVVWAGFLVPTLEGQYIIKNVALIALAIGIASRMAVMRRPQ